MGAPSRSQRRLTYATRAPLTASQIDPEILAELPASLQQEVLAVLQGGPQGAHPPQPVSPAAADPIAAMVDAVVQPRGLDPAQHACQVAALTAEVTGNPGVSGVIPTLRLVVRQLVETNAAARGEAQGSNAMLLQAQLHAVARVALEHAVSVIHDDVGVLVELLCVAQTLVEECAAFVDVGQRLVEAGQLALQAARGGRLVLHPPGFLSAG